MRLYLSLSHLEAVVLKEALESKLEEFSDLVCTQEADSDPTLNRKELFDKNLAAEKLLDKVQKQMCGSR